MNRRHFCLGAMAAALAPPHRPGTPAVELAIDPLLHEVAPGFSYRTSAYNRQVPAPVLRLRQGAPVTVSIRNHTGVEEYLHWHGLEVPPGLDGTMEEASLAVPAHGSIAYTLTPREAGVRWIHSHAMPGPGLDGGVYSGQYGIVYVEPKEDPGAYDREFFLAAHEWGAELRQSPPSEEDQEQEEDAAPAALAGGGSREVEYDIGSINGRALGAGEPLRVREGERVLFHILNASATASQRLALPGHRFEVIALDGNPVPRPRSVAVLELGPGERISALVRMDRPGVWILGAVRGSDREDGRMGAVVEYAGCSGAPRWQDPPLEPWDYSIFALSGPQPVLAPEQILPMVIERVWAGDGMESWTINGRPYDGVPARLRAGAGYRLVLDNRSDEDHPLHLHRHSFELTRVHGRPIAGLRKDVVVVRRYGRVEVDFTPLLPGLTLFHCHQQMHMDRGFKRLFEVV